MDGWTDLYISERMDRQVNKNIIKILLLLYIQMFSLARSQSFQRESGTFLVIQVAAFLLYFAGVVLRYVPHNSKDSYPSTFQWARRALSSAIVLFIGRLLEFLFVNKTLGPKLTMIRKMVSINSSTCI